MITPSDLNVSFVAIVAVTASAVVGGIMSAASLLHDRLGRNHEPVPRLAEIKSPAPFHPRSRPRRQ